MKVKVVLVKTLTDTAAAVTLRYADRKCCLMTAW